MILYILCLHMAIASYSLQGVNSCVYLTSGSGKTPYQPVVQSDCSVLLLHCSVLFLLQMNTSEP
jgi:hypothetical protein